MKPVLDACCGSRAMWYDKHDDRAVFLDQRQEECVMDGDRPYTITIAPDIVGDFSDLPFPDNTFHHVVFDPPHHTNTRLRVVSNTRKYYGVLFPGWPELLADGRLVSDRQPKGS